MAGMLASALTVALFPWGGSLTGWFALRVLNGAAGAMSLIPLETLVNRTAAPEQRSRNFGYYAFSVALGMALGNGLGMPLYPLLPRFSFVLGGVAAVLAAGAVWLWLDWPTFENERRDGQAPLLFGRNLLNFGSAWSQGYLEGAMVALMPGYLLAIGLSEAGAGGLMGGVLIGVIVFQVPVACLADRLRRTALLLGCYGVTAAALAALICRLPVPGMAVCLFLAGACSGAFYPLGLAILGERVADAGLARASAWYLAINCLGSVIGPSLTGAVMDLFGKQALFAAGEAAVLAVLAACAARHFLYRSSKAEPAQSSAEERAAA